MQYKIPANSLLSQEPQEHLLPSQSLLTGGHTEVIQQLMPQLNLSSWSASGIIREKKLSDVDHYMQLEAQQLLEKIQCYQQQLSDDLPNCSVFIHHNQFKSSIQSSAIQALILHLIQDLQVLDLWEWLAPNLEQLAYSVELLEYARCYQSDREQANRYYDYLFAKQSLMRFELCFYQQKACLVIRSPASYLTVVD